MSLEHHSFTLDLQCRYLVDPPAADNPPLIACLHGFGSNPQVMLELTRAMVGPGPVLASLQAPSEFFVKLHPKLEVGYCWATHAHPEAGIAMHHAMVNRVLTDVGERFGVPARRRALVGFSQPVGLNYRYAATFPEAVGAVIGICGGIPRDWEAGQYQTVTASLLHIAREADEIYPPEVTTTYAERLRQRASDVEFHLLEGGHRFPSKAGPLVQEWLSSRLGGFRA